MTSQSPVIINPTEPSFTNDPLFPKAVLHIPLQSFSVLPENRRLSPSPSHKLDPDTPDFSPNKAREIREKGFPKAVIGEESESDDGNHPGDKSKKKVNSNPESMNNSLKSFSTLPGPSKFKRSQTDGLNKLDQNDSNEYETGSNGKEKTKVEKRKEIMEILEISRQNNKRKGNDAEMGIFGNFKLKEVRQYLDSQN